MLLEGFFFANPAEWLPCLNFADSTKGFAAVAPIVLLAWMFGKPAYVLAKWAFNGFCRPENVIYP